MRYLDHSSDWLLILVSISFSLTRASTATTCKKKRNVALLLYDFSNERRSHASHRNHLMGRAVQC